jgi:hypothetical protein
MSDLRLPVRVGAFFYASGYSEPSSAQQCRQINLDIKFCDLGKMTNFAILD